MPSRLKTSEKLVGVKQVQRAVSNDRALTVFIAEDAEKKVVAPILNICETKGTDVVWVPTMRQLGQSCGIDVGASVAALLS